MTTLQQLLIEVMKLSEAEQQALLTLLRRAPPAYVPFPTDVPVSPDWQPSRFERKDIVAPERPFKLPEVMCSKSRM